MESEFTGRKNTKMSELGSVLGSIHKTHQNVSVNKRTFRLLVQDIMPQIRQENNSCSNCKSFKSFIPYVLNSYTSYRRLCPFIGHENAFLKENYFTKLLATFH